MPSCQLARLSPRDTSSQGSTLTFRESQRAKGSRVSCDGGDLRASQHHTATHFRIGAQAPLVAQLALCTPHGSFRAKRCLVGWVETGRQCILSLCTKSMLSTTYSTLRDRYRAPRAALCGSRTRSANGGIRAPRATTPCLRFQHSSRAMRKGLKLPFGTARQSRIDGQCGVPHDTRVLDMGVSHLDMMRSYFLLGTWCKALLADQCAPRSTTDASCRI
mmetsp:Transcript_521/g.1705  ORF Transcript_521/g.1705 Transcript_521/m.1705 type:complete len:218 (-) Transcript_521:359-1012(-)